MAYADVVGQRNVAGTQVNPATEDKQTALQDKLTLATRLAGLTFSQTVLGTPSAPNNFYETSWFDARSWPFLSFIGSIPATSAFIAELTSSTADDPNSPASADFTSVQSATIAGTTASGGIAPNNTPEFNFVGGSWVKLKLTNVTASDHAVKVVAKGLGQPMAPAIIPISAGISRAYGGAIVRAVVEGVDETSGEPMKVLVDANQNLFTRNTPNPLSNAPGRTPVIAFLEAQTADALLHTVTASKTLYATTLIVGIVNTATAAGRILIRDGTTAAGTGKLPLLTPPAGSGLLQSAVGPAIVSIPLPEPLKFTSGVFMDILAGTLTYSVAIIGYEE